MSRIVAINGSPKAGKSVSGMLVKRLEGILGADIDVYQAVRLMQSEEDARAEKASKTVANILKADVLVIAFPLYVDSLPAPLIKALTLLEQAARELDTPLPTVYGICNCGFYEAEHTRLALRMVRHFAQRAGLGWGYGVGIGCGGFVYSVDKSMEKGPAAKIYAALHAMGEAIRDGGTKEREDVFVTPQIPRLMYKVAGHMGWRKMAKKNGVSGQLWAKPHNVQADVL